MDVDGTISCFKALTTDQQAKFLVFLAWELTVVAREAYGADETEIGKPTLLRTINELQHQILGHLQKVLLGSGERFPDDVLLKVLFQISESAGHERYLKSALEVVLRRVAQ